MCTGGDPGGGSGGGGDSTPKPKPKAKAKAVPNFGAPKSSQRPISKPTPKPTPKAAPSTGGGASRRAAPTAEEMTAIRAPGQRTTSKPKPSAKAAPDSSPEPRPKSAPTRTVAASRKAPPTGEEFRAKRAPGQPDVKLPGDRRGRPKEPGGVDDRAPKKTAPQAAYDSIQELRGRLDKKPSLPGATGAALGAIGRISLKSQIKKLQEGATPVIADGMTVGAITKGGSYTGRPEYGDIARENYKKGGASIDTSMREVAERQRAQQDDDSAPPPAAPAPAPEPVVDVAQMGGSGTTTKKRRRGSGRRTAFGTRQSLVNLRNV